MFSEYKKIIVLMFFVIGLQACGSSGKTQTNNEDNPADAVDTDVTEAPEAPEDNVSVGVSPDENPVNANIEDQVPDEDAGVDDVPPVVDEPPVVEQPPVEDAGFNVNDLVGIYAGGDILMNGEPGVFNFHQMTLDFLTNIPDTRVITLKVSLNDSAIYLKGIWPENNVGNLELSSHLYQTQCTLYKVQLFLEDRIIDMSCQVGGAAIDFRGYSYALSETDNGVFFANASNLYGFPVSIDFLEGDVDDFNAFTNESISFDVYFDGTTMIMDVYYGINKNGTLRGAVDLNGDFIVERIDENTELKACQVNTESLFAHFDRAQQPQLNLTCATGTFEVQLNQLVVIPANLFF